LAAVQHAVEKRGRDFTKVTRTDVAAALREGGDTETFIGSTMRACAGGSADRATFEVVPRRPNLPASLSVEDERCATLDTISTAAHHLDNGMIGVIVVGP
jgi:hypothetical protein